MAAATFTIEPDELLGLNALVTLDLVTADKKTADDAGSATDAGAATDAGSATDAGAATDTGSATGAGSPTDAGPATGAVAAARALLDAALAEKLTGAGLSWAPSAESVAGAAERASRADKQRTRRQSAPVLGVAVLVLLWGGYARGWRWTGFQGNGQLWDWLTLLLPPVVTATVPLWVQYKKYIGRTRTVLHAAVAAAWIGFVLAGYLIPLPWTGFRGQTLWNWFELLMLPTAVACTMVLTRLRIRPATALRSLRLRHRIVMAALAAGWVVTVIGGYALRWSWTGYTGNTLWDWLQLLLFPLLFPTVLVPALLKWTTGDAAGRATQAAVARRTDRSPVLAGKAA
jgi:hypothetical protein